MKQRLEDFIRDNREAFDDLTPDKKNWENIARRLPAPRQPVWRNVAIWRAAALLFMGLSLYLFLKGDFIGSDGDRQALDQQAVVDQKTLNEFRDVEAYYFQQISEKVQLIDSYERSEGLNGFTRDIHQLEAMYMVLKEEMQTSPSQKVKDALVLNLLVRIDLLNQQLHRLDARAS